MSRGPAAGNQPRLRAAPGALLGSAPPRFPHLQGRTPGPGSLQPPRKFAQEVCPIPRPGKVAPGLFCALTYSWALGLLGWWCFVLIKECTSFQKRPLIFLSHQPGHSPPPAKTEERADEDEGLRDHPSSHCTRDSPDGLRLVPVLLGQSWAWDSVLPACWRSFQPPVSPSP